MQKMTSMSNISPWDDISLPLTDFNVRRVALMSQIACFWGRDQAGACLFIIELAGNHAKAYREEMVSVQGIGIELRQNGTDEQKLVLVLESDTNRDLFESLCRALAVAIAACRTTSAALATALAHLRRWQAFFSLKSRRLLSAIQVRGLYAELTFLQRLVLDLGGRRALTAWSGPDRSQHDFFFGGCSVEIKSISGAGRSTVTISSEDQLEISGDCLFLRVYRLSDVDNEDNSISLNDLVRSIRSEFEREGLAMEFDQKLALQGYAPIDAYECPRFRLSEVRTYQVVDGFPRLVRSGISAAICNVGYKIKLEGIKAFERTDDEISRYY